MGDLIGQQIGQYRIDALLGEGNMGSVYQAFDLNLARKVVLKVMHRQLAGQDSFQQRFMQEAQAAARLDHPSIVRIYNFDTRPSLYMVMEYVSGPSLGDYVKHQRTQSELVNLDTILRLTAQVADALDYAHTQGVVHRDIKPSNILLKPLTRPDREGDPTLRAVVTDFGLAKLLDGGLQTVTGTFMGTLSYMSPEQCLGRDLDGRSDIYSLGILLYQMATGQLPFNVKSPTDAIRMHVKELPPAPRLVRPGLPDLVEQLILQAIAKNPASRFQTGNQMAEVLRRAAWSLVSPGETQTFPSGELNGATAGRSADRSLVDQLLIYHAGEAPRVMGMGQDAIRVGRGQENDVMLPEKGVSRNHVRIERAADGWQVIDLGSTNGSYLDKLRLTPHLAAAWPPNQELRVGAYSLQWQKAVALPVLDPPAEGGAERERPPITSPGEIELLIDPTAAPIEPGDRLNVQCMLINRGPVVEHVSLRVEGLPDDWVSFSDQLVRLMPGGRGFVRVSVEMPRHHSARSGPRPFDVLATPLSNREAAVRATCDLSIDPFEALQVALDPLQVRNSGRFQVTVQNDGNQTGRYVLRAGGDVERVRCEPAETALELPPGRQQAVDVQVEAVHRPLLGRPQSMPVQMALWQGDQLAQALTGALEIRPRIPPRLWAAFWLLIALAAVAALIWFLTQP